MTTSSAAVPPCPAGGDRPYLVSGADDRLVKVWDYQTKACIQVSPEGRWDSRCLAGFLGPTPGSLPCMDAAQDAGRQQVVVAAALPCCPRGRLLLGSLAV